MTNKQAIEFVKELSRILARDQNAITAWELHCTHDFDKLCGGIYTFVMATPKQRQEALDYVDNTNPRKE